METRKRPELDDIQASAVARIFSSGIVRELGKKSRSGAFARLSRETGLVDNGPQQTVASFLDFAFYALDQPGLRTEHIYKSLLLHKILLGRHSLNTATMLTEFRVAGCRADAVILNGTSAAYEIKTERDDLQRLKTQIEAYRRVFSQVNVVTGEKHLDDVLKIVPGDVGVLSISRRRTLTTIRAPQDDPGRVDPRVIYDSLRRNEIQMILRSNGISVPNVPNTEAYLALRDLFESLSPSQAHLGMVNVLKTTRSLAKLSEFLDELPSSIRIPALSAPLTEKQRRRLVDSLSKPMRTALTWT